MTPRDYLPQRWAYVLIGLGLLFLATNFGWLGWLDGWLWALLFLAGGAAFLYHYRTQPAHWWALIPGSVLAGLGVTILAGDAGGPIFLALLGAGFAGVYLTGRQRWWAVIPAGMLFTLALVAWLGERSPGWDTGWLFFLGVAATFGTLFFLPEAQGRQRWALYPALAALALVLLTALSGAVSGVVVPLLLVLVGLFLVLRRGGSPKGPSLPSTKG